MLLAAWPLFWAVLQWMSPAPPMRAESMQMTTLVAPAYAILFLSLAVLLGRMPRSDRLAAPASVRLLFVVAVGVASALPGLVAFAADRTLAEREKRAHAS